MKIYNDSPITFQHKIIMDIGASSPKGTLKIKAVTDAGQEIFKESGPNSFVNNTVKGFDGAKGFINKLSNIIRRTQNKILLKDESGEFPLGKEDKKLSCVALFVPGTTFVKGKDKSIISFMPNLKDKAGESLTNIDFIDYIKMLKTNPKNISGVDVAQDKFDMVVTKDLGGTGVGLAKLMAKKNMLKDGDYIMGVMTGGGFGSVDLKVQKEIVNFETSESSSYIAGNYEAYGQMANIIEDTISSENPQKKLKELKQNNNLELKEKIQVLGKLGRQGVNVKSHIGTFCTEIGRPDLFPLLRSIGDARIVEMNRMCVSEKDTEIINKLRSMPNEFREIESTTDGKIAFAMNEETFGKDMLKNARKVAVNEYANSVSLISINKIDDCINKVVLLGPFAHGVNQYVKTHFKDFGGAKDLPELITNKIKINIDEKHADLPSTKRLMELYNFQVICNKDLNFADNTFAGDMFLNPKCKFVPNRGSWFNIPLSELKKG